VSIALLVSFLSGTGSIGSEASSSAGTRGVLFLCVAFLALALMLGVGALRLMRRARWVLLVCPCAVILVLGTVGEIADIIGGSTLGGNLIGAGILFCAAAPLVLVLLPRSRQWLAANSRPRRVL
jgi:hypothetical protein